MRTLDGGTTDCAKKIVGDWRFGPTAAGDAAGVERLVGLVSQCATGDSFEGTRVSYKRCCLAQFRSESKGEGRRLQWCVTRPISEHELASRLSYFLWSSMPDEELTNLADRRQLRQPGVLAAQVRRMLKDAKSASLVENFGGQWLELRRLESVKPDRERFPEFDEYLRLLMRRETENFSRDRPGRPKHY